MKLLVKTKGESEALPYQIPPEGTTIHGALGDWDLEARPKTPFGQIRVLLWSPNSKPDWKGRIKPVRTAVLSFSHPEVTFTRGLPGLGDELKITRSMQP